MEQKIKVLDEILKKTFGNVVSHRAGRWALNRDYLKILKKYGYICDCSVTPGVSWKSNLGCTGIPGADYSLNTTKPYYIDDGILEVPMSIRNVKYFETSRVTSPHSMAKELSHLVRGKQLWLRPSISTLYEMKKIIDDISKSSNDVAMFMIHSSELMPGGSPYYKDEKSIEDLYSILDELFGYIAKDYKGITLKEYALNYKMRGN